MCRIFSENGVRSRFFVLNVDEQGASVEPTPQGKSREEAV
jgi:hypothetical protein